MYYAFFSCVQIFLYASTHIGCKMTLFSNCFPSPPDEIPLYAHILVKQHILTYTAICTLIKQSVPKTSATHECRVREMSTRAMIRAESMENRQTVCTTIPTHVIVDLSSRTILDKSKLFSRFQIILISKILFNLTSDWVQ